jgi:hypothetical protein
VKRRSSNQYRQFVTGRQPNQTPGRKPGQVRCAACGRGVTPTVNKKLRAHNAPDGTPCAHRAFYAEPVALDEIPPIVIGPEPKYREPRPRKASEPRPPSRLEAGSECVDCGRWLPGERSLCGRCANRRAATRRRKVSDT